MKTNFPNISDMSDEAKEVTEAIVNDTIEKVDGEVIDKAYDEIISEPREVTAEEFNALNAFIQSKPELMAVKEALENGETVADGAITSTPGSGETINASVSINNATGERQIVDVNPEFKSDNMSFDEFIENPDIDHSNVNIDNNIVEKVSKDKFEGINPKDMAMLIQLINDYKEGKVKGLAAFDMLPEFLKMSFNAAATESRVPMNKLNAYKKHFVNTVLDDIINDAEMEQTTIDFNNQIAQIYKDYGNDVALLYQSSIFEKIKTLQETIEDLKKGNEEGLERKTDNIQAIIDGLYESIYLEKFSEFAIRAKIKPFEMEKPEKVYRDFLYKYNNSKFMISNVADIVAPLQKYCGFTEDKAKEFSILFCKYTKNMKPSNLSEHTFMYYVIANILSINALGGNIVEDENNPIKNEFIDILISNIKSIMEIRENKSGEYAAKKISKEYMDSIIIKANEKAKELEEESAKIDAEIAAEEAEAAESDLPVQYINTIETENNSDITVAELKSGIREADSKSSKQNEVVVETSENTEE